MHDGGAAPGRGREVPLALLAEYEDAMCDWCGEEHAVTALCVKRPRWSRRGFLTLIGLGAVGLALPTLPMPDVFPMQFTASFNAETKLWLAADGPAIATTWEHVNELMDHINILTGTLARGR